MDDKAAFLDGIASGVVVHNTPEVNDVVVLQHNELFIYHGSLHGRASRAGTEESRESISECLETSR